MLLSGLLDKPSSIAEHAIVVDAHLGQGNVLLFGNNPIYRGETIGTYALVFNAILNYQHLAHEPTQSRRRDLNRIERPIRSSIDGAEYRQSRLPDLANMQP